MPLRTIPECWSPPHEPGPPAQPVRTITGGGEVYAARAMTLIELLAVAALLAVMSAVVVMRIGPGTLGRPAVQAYARQLAVDLRYARSLAISTAKNHYVGFNTAGFTVYRRESGSSVAVDQYRPVPPGVEGTISTWNFEFNPSGAALAAYWCNLVDSGVTYRVSVVIATGTTTVEKL